MDDENTNIYLRLISSNPFIRSQNNKDSLVRMYEGEEAFLRKAAFKAQLFKTSTKPILRKLRTLNV